MHTASQQGTQSTQLLELGLRMLLLLALRLTLELLLGLLGSIVFQHPPQVTVYCP